MIGKLGSRWPCSAAKEREEGGKMVVKWLQNKVRENPKAVRVGKYLTQRIKDKSYKFFIKNYASQKTVNQTLAKQN